MTSASIHNSKYLPPFPYFGGKSTVADVVWAAMGDVKNYVEPFFGSGAVLFLRPGGAGRIETINDADGFVANFWRAIKTNSDAVAEHADNPVSECVPAGTMIATSEGSISVEQVRVGMTVLGFAEGRIVATRVTATTVSVTREALCAVGSLRLTGNHPVYTCESGYVPARLLRSGMTSIILAGKYEAPALDYLRLVGPARRRDSLCGSDVPQMPVHRASIAGAEGRAHAPRLLGALATRAGAGTILRGVRAGRGRRLAGGRSSVDCPPRRKWSPHESDQWGRGNAGICTDSGTSGQVVQDAAREEVRAGAQIGDARQATQRRDAGEDRCRWASTTHTGIAGEDFQIGQGTGYESGYCRVGAGQDRQAVEHGASCEDCRDNGQPPSSSLRGDRRTVLFHNGGEPDFESDRGVGLSSASEGLPLQGSAASLTVYNFQTDTANYFADGVLVHNCDLHARHLWLIGQRERITERLMGDPNFFDAKAAGWWCWGLCCWIGSGWCSGRGPWTTIDGVMALGNTGQGVNRQLPHLRNAGQGVNRQRPHLGNAGQGVNRQLPHLGDAGKGGEPATPTSGRQLGVSRQIPHLSANNPKGQGIIAQRRSKWLAEYLNGFAARLRHVRVCCGDWSRVCGPSVTYRHGLTGVFLDSPYSDEAGRTDDLYAIDCGKVANAARAWAIEHGENPLMRIAFCDYGETEMPEGWRVHRWKAVGGYGLISDDEESTGRANRGRECLWFSPACCDIDAAEAGGLFAGGTANAS